MNMHFQASIFATVTVRTISWEVNGTQFQARNFRGFLIVNYWPAVDSDTAVHSDNDEEGTYVRVSADERWDFNSDDDAADYVDAFCNELDARGYYADREEMLREWRV